MVPRDITEFPAQAFDTISIIGTQLYKYQRKYQQFYRARPWANLCEHSGGAPQTAGPPLCVKRSHSANVRFAPRADVQALPPRDASERQDL